MMFVGRGEDFLLDVSLEELKARHKVETNAKAKLRLQVALLRRKGESQPFIASVTGLPVTTVSSILRRFESRGIEGCYAIKQKGQPRKLRAKQLVKLKKVLSEPPTEAGLPFTIWTTKLIQYFVEKSFRVVYTLRQIQNIAVGFKLSLQKPRPEHLKANKQLQREFKKNSDERLRSLLVQDMRSSFWTKQSSL